MGRTDLQIRTRVGATNRDGPFSPLTPALSPLRGESEVGTFNSRFMEGARRSAFRFGVEQRLFYLKVCHEAAVVFLTFVSLHSP